MNSLKFGDIFFYDNSEYVLLAIDGQDLYALKILDIETSKDLKRAYKARVAKNNNVKQKLLIYSFIELVTPYFAGRIVTLIKTDGHDLTKASNSFTKKLNTIDCKKIKEEILASKGVPLKLQELIKSC